MSTPAHAKTTLFCSVCGHESPESGDWEESRTATELGERLVLSCPDCGATITRRPTRGVDADAGPTVADD